MNIKKILVFLSMPILLLNAGCWDYTNIEDLSFPQIIAYDAGNSIDETDAKEGKLSVTLLFPELSLSANQVHIEQITAPTLGEARSKRALSSSSNAIVQGAELILMGEQIARSGLNIDLLLREPFVKNSMLFAVVKGRADDFLDEGIKHDNQFGKNVIGLLATRPPETFMIKTTLHDMDISRTTPGKNLIAPLIEFRDDKSPRIWGTAVFKENRLIARMNQKESRILILLRGSESKGYLGFKIYEGDKLMDQGTVFMSNKRKIKVKREEDKYYFDIKITLKGDLVEHKNIKNYDEMIRYNKKIEQAIEKEILGECQDFLTQMQDDLKIDCIDISKYALANWRRELEKTIDDKEFITNAIINVEVEVNLKDIGERT